MWPTSPLVALNCLLSGRNSQGEGKGSSACYRRIRWQCGECARYCLYLPGALIPADLDAISARLGYDDLVHFAVENLVASPGAIVSANGEQFRIPTLTPARTPDGACKFLRNGRCAIHAQAPFSCAYFDCSQDRREADARSMRGLQAIAREWSTGGLYARLWELLHSLGLVAPSPIEARARMGRETREKKIGADGEARRA